MRRRGGRLALALAVITVVALVGAQGALGALTFTEKNLTNDTATQDDAAVWGDKVVYEDDTTGNDEIRLYDLSTGQEMEITTDNKGPWEPRIYGDKIVYQKTGVGGNDDVFVYDLSTGVETPLTSDADTQDESAIHGTRVVWGSDQNAPPDDFDVYAYDLVGGGTELIAGGSAYQGYPDVFGDRIVYEDYDTPSGNADIYMRDMIDGSVTKITDENANARWDDDQYDPRIWGDTVVWEDHRNPDDDVWAYDIPTAAEKRLTDASGDQELPQIFRDFVVWYGDQAAGNENIYLYDMGDSTEYPLTNSTEDQAYPDVWGNKAVWTDYRDGMQDDIWMAESELMLDRSGGLTRYETAALVSENHFANAGTVVVATGANFADALAASGLAGCYGGPLVLTLPNQLAPAAAAEITRLGATKAVIVGGEGAVMPAVANTLGSMGLTVERIGGADRYETATMIATEIQSMTGASFEKTAFIARGDEFPDALAVSPLAYYNRFPILLTRTDALPPVTEAAIQSLDIEGGVVAGGPGAVSATVKNAVDGLLATNGGGLTERWAGPTRYETAVEVAEGACKNYWAGRGFIGLAVGDNFPDALSGGAAAGREFGVLLLVRPDDLPQAAEDFVADSGDGIGWVEAFGGEAVVNDGTGNEVIQLAP